MSYAVSDSCDGLIEVVDEGHETGELSGVVVRVWTMDGCVWPVARITHLGELELLPLSDDCPVATERGYIKVRRAEKKKTK